MRFADSVEAATLREVVRDAMSAVCPPSAVRAADSASPAIRTALLELGAPGLLVAPDAGGLGLDETYLVPLMEELGFAAVPAPVVDTVAVAPSLAAVAGWADRLASGEWDCVADPAEDGVVAFGAAAHIMLSGGWAGAGPVTVVDIAAARRERRASVDPALSLTAVGGGSVIGTVDDPGAVRTAWDRGVLATAAQLVGLSRRMLRMTVDYAKDRRQFGVPIGSFQAVKHHLADATIAVEFAAPAVAMAGARLAARSPEASSAVSTAKALASDAAATAARTAIQCHGAIAYTTEYDLQLYAKRAWYLAASWGSAAWHRARVAHGLGIAPTGTRPGR